ncbi:MAG: response regulator [Muribaculaceae bacterium]|nr:response regulator [Muribaculaceae bacterium]
MGEKLKILAVDDNGISLAAIEQVLKDEFEVIPINSGLRALQYLKKEKPDLILLDVQMALKDGIETLREIRQREGCKDIPVIMLTSLRDKDTVMESSKLGVEDYVIKPFNRKDLYDRVKRVLKKR